MNETQTQTQNPPYEILLKFALSKPVEWDVFYRREVTPPPEPSLQEKLAVLTAEKAELLRQVETLQNAVASLQQGLTAVKSPVEPEPEQQAEL